MRFEVKRGIFSNDSMTKYGQFLLSDGVFSDKMKVRDFVFSNDAGYKEFGFSLLKQFWQSAIPESYHRYTGHRPLLILHICTIRHQKPAETLNYVPWHLDANFFGFDVPLWVVWAPFVETGLKSAGLEFCLPLSTSSSVSDAVIRDFWRTVKPNQRGQIVIESEDIPKLFQSSEFQIVGHYLNPGDAYVFDQYALHRTQVVPGASCDRVAVEYRITSADKLPRDINLAEKKDFYVSFKREDGKIAIQQLKDYFKL
jgi:hypothetical protein